MCFSSMLIPLKCSAPRIPSVEPPVSPEGHGGRQTLFPINRMSSCPGVNKRR